MPAIQTAALLELLFFFHPTICSGYLSLLVHGALVLVTKLIVFPFFFWRRLSKVCSLLLSRASNPCSSCHALRKPLCILSPFFVLGDLPLLPLLFVSLLTPTTVAHPPFTNPTTPPVLACASLAVCGAGLPSSGAESGFTLPATRRTARSSARSESGTGRSTWVRMSLALPCRALPRLASILGEWMIPPQLVAASCLFASRFTLHRRRCHGLLYAGHALRFLDVNYPAPMYLLSSRRGMP